jgi:PLP dependent protein
MTIAENLARIKEKIHTACIKSGRKKEDITVIGVTKTVSPALIIESIQAGLYDIGESYVQEAVNKYDQLKHLLSEDDFRKIKWHFIGSLQTNKIKYLNGKFRNIHSIYKLKQVEEFEKKIKHPICIFLELNLGNEASKTGANTNEILHVCEKALKISNIELKGLMCIPPYSDNKEDSRKYFITLRETMSELNKKLGTKMECLSMGMSNDFDIAIEEGATHVRIGTAIYGERG